MGYDEDCEISRIKGRHCVPPIFLKALNEKVADLVQTTVTSFIIQLEQYICIKPRQMYNKIVHFCTNALKVARNII